MIHLTLPVPQWQRLVRELQSGPGAGRRLPVSLHRRGEDTELLAFSRQSEEGPWLYVGNARGSVPLADELRPSAFPSEALGALALSRDGQMAGVVQTDKGLEPLHSVFFPGPGMYRVEANSPSPHSGTAGMGAWANGGVSIPSPIHPHSHTPTLPHSFSDTSGTDHSPNRSPSVPPEARWNRTIGALGAEVWSRLVSLRYGLVGLGRTGSQVALALARLGVRRLTLVDADRVERHNLGEMVGVAEADVGRLKVEALAEACRQVWPEAQVETCPASITTLRALLAVRDCDVLFGCADHDAARLATALIATAYHRVLVDVGTGVLGGEGRGRRGREEEGRERRGREEEGRETDEDLPTHHLTNPPPHQPTTSPTHHLTIGLDVRLVVPADRCLLCLGGVSNPTLARSVLQSASAERAFLLGRDWRRERAGSLFSLNQVAVGLALRLLEDLVAGRITESVWLHLDYGEDGVPQLSTPHPDRPRECALCAIAGGGDRALSGVTVTPLGTLYQG